MDRQFCPSSRPKQSSKAFQRRALQKQRIVVQVRLSSDIPAKNETIARVPDRNRLAMIIQYPYFLNQLSILWIFSSGRNLILCRSTMEIPNQSPILYIVMKPAVAPKVVISKAGKKSIRPIPTKEPPHTMITSLGDGGKIFSIYAIEKSAM